MRLLRVCTCRNGKCGLNDLHCLDIITMEWSVPMTTGMTPSTRNNHSTFVHGSRLYIHGGHDGVKWLADFHCLELDRMEWSVPIVSGTVPSARACHTITLSGSGKGKAFLFGGYDGLKCACSSAAVAAAIARHPYTLLQG